MQWKLPDLGEGVQEGEIVKWLVKTGDVVSVHQPMVEIMTDKATMEIPSSMDGVVQKLLINEGEIAKVGQALAEMRSGFDATSESKSVETEKTPSPPKKDSQEQPNATQKSPPLASQISHVLASPSVRRKAREKGIDLGKFEGSGFDGRVLLHDLDGGRKKWGAVAKSKGEGRLPAAGPEERHPLRGLRRKIAEHMVLSRKMAAHFTHFDEIDLTLLTELRNKEKERGNKSGVKVTFLAYFAKAACGALKKIPSVNASLDEESQEIVLKKYFNIGIAVATPNGLIVPNIKNADQLSLVEIAGEIGRLAEAARANKIQLEDLKNGTFTLTNIGSIGGTLSAPIINYPEAAILGVHKIKPSVEVYNGEFAIRQMMNVSLSGDHRVIDGAEAAQFVNEMKRLLENPNELL